VIQRAWRIVKSRLASDAFDGEGARLHGGRWNSPGTAMVYLATSESLAALELLVHLQSSHLLMSYCSIGVELDDASIEILDAAALPADWRSHPAPAELQRIGDRWVSEGRSLGLRVPSAIVPREANLLINPIHPQMHDLAIGPARPFDFDPRLK